MFVHLSFQRIYSFFRTIKMGSEIFIKNTLDLLLDLIHLCVLVSVVCRLLFSVLQNSALLRIFYPLMLVKNYWMIGSYFSILNSFIHLYSSLLLKEYKIFIWLLLYLIWFI
jgi:hypothetical protein